MSHFVLEGLGLNVRVFGALGFKRASRGSSGLQLGCRSLGCWRLRSMTL